LNISIRSLGPVRSYEFDLDKDLHLIVGANSVGKFYALTFIYLILKALLGIELKGLPAQMRELLDDPDLTPQADRLRLRKEHEKRNVSQQMAKILPLLLGPP